MIFEQPLRKLVGKRLPLVLCGLQVVCMGLGCGRATPDARVSSVAFGAKPGNGERKLADSLSQHNTELYDPIVENPFVDVWKAPQSTFAIDVDTASYANVRRLLRSGRMPTPGAVRIEELVNYFHFSYPEPSSEVPFSITTECAPCPWNASHQLLRIGLKGRSIEKASVPGSNLVFLIDVSGSMLQNNKLPLVKRAMRMLVSTLQEQDRVAMVVYAGASGLVLDSTSAIQATPILAALEALQAGGSTNGGEGIRLAYRVAEENYIEGGVNRVILCTDGDFNVGTTSPDALVELIENMAKSKVYLTVLGFGSGNLKDATMEKLANRGNGNYAYLDSELEAKKVLVEEVGGTLVTIAKDVKIQVDFNPRHVGAYRLIGYENRILETQDFRDDTKDAGEIGAGHCVTALYELVPPHSNESPTRPSEFVTPVPTDAVSSSTMLTVNLRFQEPDTQEFEELQVRVEKDQQKDAMTKDMQFAAAVAAYGMLLRGSEHAAAADWNWVVKAAESSIGEDLKGIRTEFVALAKLAQRLSEALPEEHIAP